MKFFVEVGIKTSTWDFPGADIFELEEESVEAAADRATRITSKDRGHMPVYVRVWKSRDDRMERKPIFERKY